MDKDEHSPYYVEPQESWGSFFWDLGKVALIVLALALFLAPLTGCGEYEEALRRAQVQEQNNRIARACFPDDDNQRITVVRENGFLHFTYIDIGPGRYAKTFPHVEVRVATLEAM